MVQPTDLFDQRRGSLPHLVRERRSESDSGSILVRAADDEVGSTPTGGRAAGIRAREIVLAVAVARVNAEYELRSA